MGEHFIPLREIAEILDEDLSVVVCTDGERFGLSFRNGEERTRMLLSKEAMRAVVSSFASLAAGRGDEIKREWRCVAEHRVVKEAGDGSA